MNYEVIVIGGGHAGIEASLVSARMGVKTLLITILTEQIGASSCNPAIGGLAKGHLVKELDAMGGEIGYQANRPKGSCFFVELHIDSCHPFEADFDQTLLIDSDQEGALGKTILYIEDNPANLKLVSHVLAKRDHTHLITAHEPQLGIELAKANKPDLILLDINMPGMSGYEVLEVFKKVSEVSQVPVVAITANAMSHDIRRGKRAGFDDYLTKPLDVENFLNVVERYLTRTEAK